MMPSCSGYFVCLFGLLQAVVYEGTAVEQKRRSGPVLNAWFYEHLITRHSDAMYGVNPQ